MKKLEDLVTSLDTSETLSKFVELETNFYWYKMPTSVSYTGDEVIGVCLKGSYEDRNHPGYRDYKVCDAYMSAELDSLSRNGLEICKEIYDCDGEDVTEYRCSWNGKHFSEENATELKAAIIIEYHNQS